jgi:hypothetical protein
MTHRAAATRLSSAVRSRCAASSTMGAKPGSGGPHHHLGVERLNRRSPSASTTTVQGGRSVTVDVERPVRGWRMADTEDEEDEIVLHLLVRFLPERAPQVDLGGQAETLVLQRRASAREGFVGRHREGRR